MKKTISLTLAAILAASALASCATAPTASAVTSSDYADEAWLKSRLGEVPANVTVGTADSLGLDMSSFEDDGYFIRTDSGETVVCGKTADGLDRAVRRYAKQLKDGVTFDVNYHEGARIEKLTVAGRDISEYTVAYTHTETVRTPSTGYTHGNGEAAAMEFVRLLKQATGVTLPTVDLASSPKPSPCILFEANDSPDGSNPYGETGYAYSVEDGDLVFRGSGLSNGVMNGVWAFFDRECMWDGLLYGDSILAESDLVAIPADLSFTGTLRFDTYSDYGNRADPFSNARRWYTGAYAVACHGIQTNRFTGDLIDPATEQPCYLDEEWYEILRDNVEIYIKNRLAAGAVIGDDFNYVDVAHGDNGNWCSCELCRNMYRKEGATSASVVTFANRLSAEMNDPYPGLKFLIFAYEATKCPPKTVRTNEFVYVTFCMDGACYKHSLTSGECTTATFRSGGAKNDTYAKWIRTWADMDGELYIWYYTMDGAFSQYNTIDVFFEDLNFFRDVGAEGIFLEADNDGLGINRMNYEVLALAQWDPDITKDELHAALDAYVEREFGEDAVNAHRAFADLLYSSQIALPCDTCWITENFNPSAADYAFIGERMETVLAGLAEAIENAESCVQEKRTKRLALALLYEGVYGRYYYPADGENDEADLARLNELYDLFVEWSVECGYDMDAYTLGISYKRPVSRTLEGEVAYWNSVRK